MSTTGFRVIGCALLVLAGAGLLATVAGTEPSAPGMTSAGTWHGTWQYGNVQERIALFLRESGNGSVEIRVRYAGQKPVQLFDTDWDGSAEYTVRGMPASFELTISEQGADHIRGTIRWDFPFAGDVRERRVGEFVIYRQFDGRFMQLHVAELAQERYSGEKVIDTRVGPLDWSFRKRSKRIVRWEELPS